jgi:hypothetical protein
LDIRVRRAENSGVRAGIPGAWTASGMPLRQYTRNVTSAQAFSLVQK